MSSDYEQVKLRVWQSEGAYLTMRPLASSWEQRKLGDVTKIKTGDSDLQDAVPNGLYPFFVRSDKVERSNRYLFDGEAILVPGEGRLGEIFHYINGKFDYHQRVYKISDFVDVDAKFVMYSMMYGFKKHALENTAKATVDSIRLPTLTEFKFRVPCRDEQYQINVFFSRLDNLITLHQRKYDKLCAVKKSMLDKMFPKPGETEPEIRFAGFTDPWEQRKLGELGFAQSGIGFPNTEQGGTEGTPFFKVSDMNMSGNEHELVTSNNYVTPEQIARMGWHPINQVPAIFFAKVGAAVMLNRKRLVNKPFLMDNNTMAFSMDSSLLNTQFGQSLFERLDLTCLIQVGALPSYNSSDVESITVSLPSTMDEQRQIGECLCNINDLITLHQRKLNLLKNTKKSLLDRMFV